MKICSDRTEIKSGFADLVHNIWLSFLFRIGSDHSGNADDQKIYIWKNSVQYEKGDKQNNNKTNCALMNRCVYWPLLLPDRFQPHNSRFQWNQFETKQNKIETEYQRTYSQLPALALCSSLFVNMKIKRDVVFNLCKFSTIKCYCFLECLVRRRE